MGLAPLSSRHPLLRARVGARRRRRACDPVQSIAPDRAFPLSLCGDPPGHAGGGGGAVAPHLSAAGRGGTGLAPGRCVFFRSPPPHPPAPPPPPPTLRTVPKP